VTLDVVVGVVIREARLEVRLTEMRVALDLVLLLVVLADAGFVVLPKPAVVRHFLPPSENFTADPLDAVIATDLPSDSSKTQFGL
jgi:hypothetical protein